jgi:methionine synthase II (cobalamin-independent)
MLDLPASRHLEPNEKSNFINQLGMGLGVYDIHSPLVPRWLKQLRWLVRELEDHVVTDILFDPIISVYYATIKLFSEMDLNVIVDTVIDNDKWFNDFYELLSDFPILFVGVLCSKEELTRRE